MRCFLGELVWVKEYTDSSQDIVLCSSGSTRQRAGARIAWISSVIVLLNVLVVALVGRFVWTIS